MGAGKEADGSGLARQTLSSPRTAQATVCLEGRERETGRGGGSQREVVAKTALPTLQFCQGPRRMRGLPPKTIFRAAGSKSQYPDCLKFKNPQALPV